MTHQVAAINVAHHEQQVIGIALADPERLTYIDLPATAFTDRRHRQIYVSLLELFYSGEPITTHSIASATSDIDQAYLARLLIGAESTGIIAYHAEQLAKAYRDRQARDAIASMVRAVESGRDPIEVLQSAAAVADTIEDNGKAKDFGLVPASQFIAASHQVNYLVDGMVAEGQSLLIAAAEKCFKTTLAVDLVTSITTGERFLGQFDVLKKTPVLMFSGESGDAKLTQTLRAVCAAKGIDYSDLRDLIITTELPQLGNAADIVALRRQIKRHNAGMIVLDPAYLCMDIAVPGRWTSMRGQARRTIRRNGTSPYRDQATPYVALRKARGSSSDAGRMSASSR